MIFHLCPHCQRTLGLAPHLAGQAHNCPECGAPIKVPPQSTVVPVAVPVPDSLPATLSVPSLADSPPLPRRLRQPRKPGGRRRRGMPVWVYWGVLAAVAAVLFGVGLPACWFGAGYTFVTVLLFILGFVFVVSVYPLTRWMTAQVGHGHLGKRAVRLYTCALVLEFVFLAAGYALHVLFAQSTVYVDNFSNQNVQLELNGRPWRPAPNGSAETTRLRRGTYELVVKSADTGAELDRHWVEVGDAGDYVLNVLGAQVYTRGTAYCGPAGVRGPPEATDRVTDKWFRVEVEYLFKDPPREVNFSRGHNEGLHSYLVRGDPTQGRP
jgi:hypothetical protein